MKEVKRRQFIKKSLIAGGTMAVGAGLFASEKLPAAGQGGSNATLSLIHSLRTIHGDFSGKDIPDADIESIVGASVRAANASNMQSYSIIVVKDRQKMQDVCGYQGGCMLVFCADHHRIHASAQHLGHPYESGTIVNFVTAAMNTMLAAQTAVIAAKSLGIDSLLTNGVHRGDMERQWKILGLPEKYCFPLIALVLGYPNQEPETLKGRLTGPGVVHREAYHDLSVEELDNLTKQYDDKATHLALNPEWDSQGFNHYQDWLYGAWLGGRSEPPKEETQMFKLLKRSGYVDLQKT